MNILVLGIGNILFQDEGIGVHFVHYIDEKYSFESDSATLVLMDGGTLAQRLIPIIVKYDYLIVVDCIGALDSKAGDVYFFDFENTPDEINWQASAHEVEMLQTLNMIRMSGDLPKTKILGVIPQRVADDTTFELSCVIITAVLSMENTLLRHLKSLDIIPLIKKPDTKIIDIAQISFKREMIHVY